MQRREQAQREKNQRGGDERGYGVAHRAITGTIAFLPMRRVGRNRRGRRCGPHTPSASASRAPTTKIFRSRPGSLPARMRPHVAALYAFARTADDFADEGRRPDAERLRLLDDWQNRLHACVDGDAILTTGCFSRWARPSAPAIFRCRSFDDLLSAFRQDITTHRYETWDDVLDYCRRSANPVGRLVLRIAGYDDARLDRSSDALCTALQLTNFWQDLDRDWQNGRLYVPLDDVEARAARACRISPIGRLTSPGSARLSRVAARTRQSFRRGTGRLRRRARPAALRAALHLARRHADSRPARRGRLRRVHVQAGARRCGCAVAAVARADMTCWKARAGEREP